MDKQKTENRKQTMINHTIYLLSFRFIELIGFLLPAIPDSFFTRLCVLTGYFVAHIFGLPTQYMHMKHQTLDSLLKETGNVEGTKDLETPLS